jgi:hypothetical protein
VKPKVAGVGLHRVVPALDAYIYARKNPWVPWLAGGAATLLLVGLGFGIGRWTAKPKAGRGTDGALARRRYIRRRR